MFRNNYGGLDAFLERIHDPPIFRGRMHCVLHGKSGTGFPSPAFRWIPSNGVEIACQCLAGRDIPSLFCSLWTSHLCAEEVLTSGKLCPPCIIAKDSY